MHLEARGQPLALHIGIGERDVPFLRRHEDSQYAHDRFCGHHDVLWTDHHLSAGMLEKHPKESQAQG